MTPIFLYFKEHEIDEATFRNLTDMDVAELIPTMGTRKKFLSKFVTLKTIVHVSKTYTFYFF